MMWGWGSYDGSGNEISGGRELNERRDHFAVVYVQFPWLHDQSAEPILSIALISHQEFRMAWNPESTAKGVFSSRKVCEKIVVARFGFIWQLLSNYGVISLKKFVSSFTTKLCN